MCVFTEVYLISFPGRNFSPYSIMLLYSSFCTRGFIIRRGLYESLLLLLISSMEAFYRSGHKVMSLGGGCSLPLMPTVSILSLKTPASLLLGQRDLRHRAFSLIFSVVRRVCIFTSS